MRIHGSGFEVEAERLRAAEPVLRGYADELARARADALRLLAEAAEELPGLRSGVAVARLSAAVGEAGERLTLALQSLAVAMPAAADAYLAADRSLW